MQLYEYSILCNCILVRRFLYNYLAHNSHVYHDRLGFYAEIQVNFGTVSTIIKQWHVLIYSTKKHSLKIHFLKQKYIYCIFYRQLPHCFQYPLFFYWIVFRILFPSDRNQRIRIPGQFFFWYFQERIFYVQNNQMILINSAYFIYIIIRWILNATATVYEMWVAHW